MERRRREVRGGERVWRQKVRQVGRRILEREVGVPSGKERDGREERVKERSVSYGSRRYCRRCDFLPFSLPYLVSLVVNVLVYYILLDM